MYNEHFGLTENPFSIAPDPRYLYLSEQHREALAHLIYGIHCDGGFVLLTGEVGTGKTTICRCLIEQLPEDCDVAFIFNPRLTVRELLSTICDELRIKYPPATKSIKLLVDLINKHLLSAHARGRRTVLIIDEAQNLKSDVLEQIRLLTNLETNQRKLLQIILLGQPELRDKLSRPELRQLSQRIVARYHLRPLNAREVAAYVNHRLVVAGSRRSPFPAPILAQLHHLGGGIPRLLNVLCDRALLGCYVQGRETVDRATLQRAAQEVFGRAKPQGAAGLKMVFRALALLATLASGVLLAAAYYHYRAPATETRSATDDQQPSPVLPSPAAAEPRQAPGTEHPVPPAPAPADNAPAAVGPPQATVASAPPPAPAADQESAAQGGGNRQEDVKPAAPSGDNPVPQETREITQFKPPETPSPVAAPPAAPPAQPAKLAWPADQPIANSQAAAMLALLRQWGADYHPEQKSSVCQQAEVQHLACLAGKASLDDLRRLNRPAVLKLYGPDGREFHALLTALDGQQAHFVVGGRQLTVPVDEIGQRWLGDYTLLWRLPPDYRGALKPGAQGPAVQWLQKRLARVQGKPKGVKASAVFDEALANEVKKFQLTSGLLPDGIAGPQTLILLDSAAGPNAPVLTQKK